MLDHPYHPDHDAHLYVSDMEKDCRAYAAADWLEDSLRDMFAGEVLMFGAYKVGRGLWGPYWYVDFPCGYHCESQGAAPTATFLRNLLNIRQPLVDHEGDLCEHGYLQGLGCCCD